MRVFDLSQTLRPTSLIYPGDEPTTWRSSRTLERDGYNAVFLQSCLHVATHIDAPLHLCPGGRGIADFPPERFIGRGVLLDARGLDVIDASDVNLDDVRAGDAVLVLTGHDRFAGDPDIYFGQHPSLGRSLAEALIERHISFLGLDMPSPDHAPYDIHHIFLKKEIFIVENLLNLSSVLCVKAFEVFALPIKVEAEAAFARVIAVEK